MRSQSFFRNDTAARHAYDLMGYEAETLSLHIKADVLKTIPVIIADHIPDACDTVCGLWGGVVPAVLEELGTYVSDLPGVDDMNAPSWGFVDSVANIFKGGVELSDQNTHRPTATKMKGVVNISSGLTLGILTGVSMTLGAAAGAALASQALAGAIGVSFVLSCDEVMRTMRRVASPLYWLKDSIGILEKLETTTIPEVERKLEKQSERYNSLRSQRFGQSLTKKERAMLWLLTRKENRLKKLKQLRSQLELDIQNRVEGNEACNRAYKEHLSVGTDSLSLRVRKIFTGRSPDLDLVKGKWTEKKLIAQNRKEFQKATNTALLLGVLFAGTLLLCFPAAQVAATILLGIYTGWFLAKNTNSIRKTVPKIAKNIGTFFSKNAGRVAVIPPSDEIHHHFLSRKT